METWHLKQTYQNYNENYFLTTTFDKYTSIYKNLSGNWKKVFHPIFTYVSVEYAKQWANWKIWRSGDTCRYTDFKNLWTIGPTFSIASCVTFTKQTCPDLYKSTVSSRKNWNKVNSINND